MLTTAELALLLLLLLCLESASSFSATVHTVIPSSSLHELFQDGFTIVDNFLSFSSTSSTNGPEDVPTEVQALSADIYHLRDNGRFRAAKIGKKLTNDPGTRIAEHCFLHNNKQADIPNAIRDATLQKLKCLREQLASEGGFDLEPELDDLLYIYYPNGGFYRRHVDATPGTPSVLREFSILLYLQDEPWDPDYGGQLRLHLDESSLDIDPLPGRLVVLQSHLVPHEVLETCHPRLALVGWFCREPTREEIEQNDW